MPKVNVFLFALCKANNVDGKNEKKHFNYTLTCYPPLN